MKSKLAHIALVFGLIFTSLIGTFAFPAKPARAAVAASAWLTVDKGDIFRPGLGSGKVVSSKGTLAFVPTPIDCGVVCAVTFPTGSTAYLTATANSGSAFTGWGGACSSYGSSPYCHVTMNSDKSVTALFATTHPVAVTKNGNGVGTVTSTPSGINCGATCSTTLPYSTIVTLTASPSTGSQFAGWSGDCSVTNTGSCVTTVTGDEDVTATFNLITYTVNAAKAGNGSGSITSAPAGINCGATCSTSYNYNTPITLTASADTGSTFTGWQGDCTANGSSCSTTVTGARNITATFTLITYTVAVTKTGNGSGGITSTPGGIDCGATCDTSLDYNTVVTLTAAPDSGSFLAGWEGDCAADGLSCTTTVTNARNVTATFTLITYTVSVTKTGNGNGVITSTLGNIDCGVTCSTSLDYNTPVTLTAAADTGSYFTGWEGDCAADGLSCAATVTGTRDVTATFTLITYTVSITKDGNGSGVITSTPGNIDCGGTCDTNLDYNTPVTLTAAADTGSYFAGWQGDCTADGLTCTTTVTGTRDVTATFTLITYTVSVTKTGNGTGVITTTPGSIDCGATCNASFDYNTVLTLTATADTGSVFTGWTGDCAVDGLSCTTTVTGTRDVTATFTLITYTLSVSTTGAGSVTSDPPGIDCGATCREAYDYNTVVTLTATPDTGYYLASWEGDCSAGGFTCTTTVTGTRDITATFTLITYTLSMTKTGNGSGVIASTPGGVDCGITCSTSYDYNTPVTLTAAADTGSYFAGWEGDCAVDGFSCTTTMTGTRNVTATFTLITYTLSVTTSGAGTGSITSDPSGIDCGATCSDTYDYNTVVTLTATPDTGYYLSGWQGDCAADDLSCTTTVTGTRNVTATFGILTYTISVVKDGNGTSFGTVTSDPSGIDCGITCSTSYDYNTPVTLTASADTGAFFAGWEGDCTVDGLSCTTTMTGTRDVTATFTLITYTVSVTKTGNGSGSIATDPSGIDCGTTCSGSFNYTSTVTLTATADTGSTFMGWTGDCIGTVPCTVTIDAAKNVTATFTLVTHTLTIHKAGDSVGTVTSDPAGIDCGLTCTVDYDYGTMVTLTQQTITGTAFAGWQGDCNGMGPCVVTISGNQSVTATFNLITTDLGVSQSVTRSIGTITFTVVVTNGGPSDANGTIISDTVTSEIDNPQWACQAANGASCPAPGRALTLISSGVYSIYDTLPLFPAGGVVTYTISGNVGLLAQRLTNVAQVIAPTGVTDISEPDDLALLISGYRVMFPVIIKGN